MEVEKFEKITTHFCTSYQGVTKGKMMSAPAIHFHGKVFAFLSSKNKMVFKLGDAISTEELGGIMTVFSPFKNKKPMKGWYEVDVAFEHNWEKLTLRALNQIKKM